ncbi:MAG: DUF1801 domain-containing protein [Anaerolineales bacterium]|nr:DUF1801 domain-containing protein [Anaerolineales bacterium]
MKVSAKTIEEFFLVSGEQENDLRELDRLIVKTAPNLKRQLFSGPSITMLGYGEMTWMNKSSSGVWPLISVAPQKGTISIYVAAEKDGVPLATIYKKRLGKTNNGKTCIRFKRLADISINELRNAIKDAITWSKTQETIFGRNCAQPVEEET